MRPLFLFYLSFFLFGCVPFSSRAAEQANFLAPVIRHVQSSLVCPNPQSCQSVFFIQGKNFLSSNGKPGVFVANRWAKILRASDTQIVAATGKEALNSTPVVSIDQTLHRPSLHTTDSNLNQLFDESVTVALQSIAVNKDGERYFTAGPRYNDPPRVYYRDSYWTSGMILLIEPSVVRDQILLLARGITPDGSVPSAIPVDPNGKMIPLWIDHQDSGSYFIMMVDDYIRFTSDTGILRESVGGRSIYSAMKSILTHLASLDTDGNALPEKPSNSLQDWLDTIPRGGEVISNEVLYYHALRNMVELSSIVSTKEESLAFDRRSLLVRSQINDRFWNEIKGFYNERCEKDVCDQRLTNESSLASLYEVIDPENTTRFFDSLKQLETKSNKELSSTDWGVVNAIPPYPNTRVNFYQNQTDWPYLDAINAGARLKEGNPDWYYPLTRWWLYFKTIRKPGQTLPEFVSPVDPSGGSSQAWSVAPIISFVRYGFGLDPTLTGRYTLKSPIVGSIQLDQVMVRGKRVSLETPESK